MSGDVHVRFCESLRGRFPWATRRAFWKKGHETNQGVLRSSENVEVENKRRDIKQVNMYLILHHLLQLALHGFGCSQNI